MRLISILILVLILSQTSNATKEEINRFDLILSQTSNAAKEEINRFDQFFNDIVSLFDFRNPEKEGCTIFSLW